MSATPWMKFYPSDWRSDPRLRICSLAARGLWMEMLALMHEAKPYGHLLVSGHAVTDAQLAALAGTTPDQITDLIGELETAGVFSRTGAGVIYSRRMTRDDKKARTARKNGQNGGNPTLRKQTDIPLLDKGQDKGEVKAQKPDTRSQKPDKKKIYGRSDDATDDAFERFWKAYPSRGDSPNPKKPCQAKFASAVKAGADPEAIIRGAARYADKMAGEPNRALVCQAQTFLNQARWEQYADAPAAPPPRDLQREQWRQRLIGYRDHGTWLNAWGARPGDKYCDAPADLVAQIVNPKENAA